MNEAQKQDKEEKLSEKEQLEALLAETNDNLEVLAEEAKKLAPKKSPLVFDYLNIKNTSESEASSIVNSSAAFYVPKSTIDSEEYISNKISADIVFVSDMLRQTKIAEYAICKMLEQIEEGDMHPRTFEVLAGFQKTKLELTQALAKYVTTMESNYKQIKSDYTDKTTENADVIQMEDMGQGKQTADGGVVFTSTRSMLEMVRKELDRNDIEERKKKMEETLARQEIENKNRTRVNGGDE